LDDRDLLDRAFAAANGPKFRALWQGEINGYASASEAELALINMIAFWTGPDEHRIDQLFRQSGLIRPKWEQREEYRAATIAKALNRPHRILRPTTRTSPARGGHHPGNRAPVATAAIKMEGTRSSTPPNGAAAGSSSNAPTGYA
jgi:putative DNA primase/helicase